jgi:hypothetical protein
MTESLPADVADVLATVLSTDNPVHVALRRQVPHLSVRGRCTCGCGTAYFELDTRKTEPAPTGPSTVVAAESQLVTEAGECPARSWSSRKAAICRGWQSVHGATTSR